MSIGIPTTNQILPFSEEALQYKSKQFLPGSLGALFYEQYAATSAVSTTGVSLVNNTATTANGTPYFPAGAWNWNNGYSPSGGAPTLVGPGGMVNVKIMGTLTTSGSPAFQLVFKWGANTLSTVAANTPSVVASAPFIIDLYAWVSVYGSGTTGSIVSQGTLTYWSASALSGAAFPLTTTASIDTTIAGLFDVLTTGTITTTAFTPTAVLMTALN
jgi:hypothetical protein